MTDQKVISYKLTRYAGDACVGTGKYDARLKNMFPRPVKERVKKLSYAGFLKACRTLS